MTNITSKVASIIKGNGWRRYVVAQLACGHNGDVERTPEPKFGTPEWKVWDNAHDESTWVTKVGDEVACKYCGFYQDALAKLKALDPATISHSRMRHSQIYVYAYDKTSPTGVSNVLNIDPTDEVEQILRSRFSATPLSPTEAR